MKILILGMGHVGKALASQLRTLGHNIVGTTTTPEKVAELSTLADEVFVLRGSETEKVKQAATGCDAIIVTVAPNVRNTRTIEERETEYHEVLEKSATSAAAACDRIIFLSSFSVYGDGGEGRSPIDESTPTSNHKEPSSRYYQAAERATLSANKGCVLRFPDMYGAPGDMSFTQRVKMAHEYFGGKVIFSADAPLYCIHFEDVVASVTHALQKDLKGIFNVCDNENIPFTNQQVFDAITDKEGLSRLEYTGQIKAPNRKISATKIYASGFRVMHVDPNADLVAKSLGAAPWQVS
ncbi:MAG: NAD-dependent epimerase/dehydratase family protein [Spongiibacteraceae bacterium]